MNTRSNAPYKLTRHIYFVKEIPIPTNMMIRENKFHKKTVFSWLKDNTDTMELSDDQIMFLRSEATKFVAKNLTKKSNSGLNKTIKHEFHYSYASMPENTCYVAYEQDKAWLVLDTIEEFAQHDSDSDSDSNNEQQYELYVLNKCVFKP